MLILTYELKLSATRRDASVLENEAIYLKKNQVAKKLILLLRLV